MAFKYQFETILNLKIRMEDMKNAELKLALERLENEMHESAAWNVHLTHAKRMLVLCITKKGVKRSGCTTGIQMSLL